MRHLSTKEITKKKGGEEMDILRENKKIKKKGGEREMKKWMVVIVTLVLVVWGAVVHAYPTFEGSTYNYVYFKNYENWVDVDQDGKISVGDYFYGILSVQNIDANGVTIWDSAQTDQFSGYFLTQVVTVNDPDGDPYDYDNTIIFGPYSGTDPYGILNPSVGEVMALYVDTATPFEYNGTVQDDIAKATDGTLWATLGFVTNDPTNPPYWYTPNVPLVPPGTGNKVGESYAGLNFIQNNTGIPDWKLINDPVESVVDSDVQVYFTSEIEDYGPNGVYNTWRFKSNDPATMYPLPEPTTLFLLGTGLIGFAGIGRKKLKK